MKRAAICLLPALAIFITGGKPKDEEKEALGDRSIECCDRDGECQIVPALRGCQSVRPDAPSENPNERRLLEESAPLDWLAADGGPFITPRGRLAEAILSDRITLIFVGEVEEAYAYEGARLGGWGINTWCTVRVEVGFKGSWKHERVALHYFGGRLPDGRQSFLSHEPRCSVGDYGVFSAYDVEGVSTADERATISMSSSQRPWFEHPLTEVLSALADAIGNP